MKKKLVALILSVAMMFSIIPISFASSSEEEEKGASTAVVYMLNDKSLKKEGTELFKGVLGVCQNYPVAEFDIFSERDGKIINVFNMNTRQALKELLSIPLELRDGGPKLGFAISAAQKKLNQDVSLPRYMVIISDSSELDSLKVKSKEKAPKGIERLPNGNSRPSRPRPVRPRPVRPRPIATTDKVIDQVIKSGISVYMLKIEKESKPEEVLPVLDDLSRDMNEATKTEEKPIEEPIEKPIEKPAEKDIKRLSGNSRIETAVEVSKDMYKTSEAVFLANPYKFPDVLAASPLAAQKNAPILFAEKNKLPKETLEEIKRLGAKRVYLIGGENSVSKKVEEALSGKEIFRVSGDNRYATSAKIAELVKNDGNKEVVEMANGQNFPDALSISPLAIKDKAPIVLVEKNKIPKEATGVLSGVKTVKIAGMYGSVSKDVEKAISKEGTKVERYGGADRYETSAKIAKLVGSKDNMGVYTSGEIFADALVAGGYAGSKNAPLLLVTKKNAPKVIVEVSRELKIDKARIIGGEAVITKDCEKDIVEKILK